MSLSQTREQYLAGGLAAFVHVLFLLVLVFGVSWKHYAETPVYAELWSNLPGQAEMPPPRVVEKPVAPPEPKPVVRPKETVAKPDIALEAAKKREAQRKLEEAKRVRLAEAMKQAEQDKLAQEAKQREAQVRAAAEQQQKAQDAARKNLEAMLAAQASQELNREKQAVQQQAAAAASSKVVDDYIGRIRQKIHGLIRLPAGLQGNPEAVYRVDLLPNGEVLKVTQVRSSRQPAYDQEVERAIWKASPLPLPPDRNAADSFRNGLELHFRPHDS